MDFTESRENARSREKITEKQSRKKEKGKGRNPKAAVKMYHPIKLRSDKGNKKAKGGKDKS